MKFRSIAKKINAFLSVFLCMAVAACAFGCNGKSEITLKAYTDELDFHTADQRAFAEAGDDYDLVAIYADGMSEKSRPEAIELSWSDSATRSGGYTVEISETPDFSDCITLHSKENSVSVYNLKIGTQYSWRVSADGAKSDVGSFKTSALGPRNLYVDGVTNVRDIGGYATKSGKRMAQGLIYRGARLNKSDVNDDSYATAPTEFVKEITAAGEATLKDVLKVKTEVDLRLLDRNGYPESMGEVSAVDGIEYVRIPMNGNASIIDNAEQIKQFFELLADTNSYPVYFHCNIGTDRTGMFTYLLQALCGADEADMMRDYLFSNYGLIGEAKTPDNKKNAFVKLLGAGGEYAGGTLAERTESYLKSIGVSEDTYNTVRDILLGEIGL